MNKSDTCRFSSDNVECVCMFVLIMLSYIVECSCIFMFFLCIYFSDFYLNVIQNTIKLMMFIPNITSVMTSNHICVVFVSFEIHLTFGIFF